MWSAALGLKSIRGLKRLVVLLDGELNVSEFAPIDFPGSGPFGQMASSFWEIGLMEVIWLKGTGLLVPGKKIC